MGTTKEEGYGVSPGRLVGPTKEEGYGVSPGRRVGTTKEEGIVLVQVNYLEVQQQGRSMVLVQGD